jgi:hypothetical protein
MIAYKYPQTEVLTDIPGFVCTLRCWWLLSLVSLVDFRIQGRRLLMQG